MDREKEVEGQEEKPQVGRRERKGRKGSGKCRTAEGCGCRKGRDKEKGGVHYPVSYGDISQIFLAVMSTRKPFSIWASSESSEGA